ncbi:hypothetical protein OHB49_01195 [Streptomyces sp. NBC_01717]|nr:hypothetical protein [Streptomyces sp. NBC_01717]
MGRPTGGIAALSLHSTPVICGWAAGFVEVEAFNTEQYAHHRFERNLER